MGQNCVDKALRNTDNETAHVANAVLKYGDLSHVDPRLILATVLQASQACVRVPTTGGIGLWNPGLMQSHNGLGTCWPGSNQSVPNAASQIVPCPQIQIDQMIYDGVSGPSEYTLATLINSRCSSGVPRGYYEAFRMYNSGINGLTSDLSHPRQGDGTPQYVSDIANRVCGWNGL